MFVRSISASTLVLSLQLCATAIASVQVPVFDSFGASNSFNIHSGVPVEGSSASFGYEGVAFQFTPATSANLFEIDLALSKVSGSGLSNISLAEDSAGLPTGTVLESFNNILANGTFGQSPPPVAILSLTHPTLNAGQTYWLRAEPSDSTVVNQWNLNSQNVINAYDVAIGPGQWFFTAGPLPADGTFRILGTSTVPEPATTLAATALAALLIPRRRKR
jgi:hypothetical protein